MGNNSSGLIGRLHLSPHPVYETQEYELFDAHEGYKKLSLFVFKSLGEGDLINFSAWKSLRHPLILQYLDSGVIKGLKCVLTEYVLPLNSVIDNYSRDEVISGLQEVATALDFLHSTCFFSHNNVSISSIFVSHKSVGSWKVGCPQLMSTPDEETYDFVKKMVIYKGKTHTYHFLPPEDSTPDVSQPITSLKEIHRRDSFAFGSLIEQILMKRMKESCEQITGLVSRLKCIEKDDRPGMKVLLDDDLFGCCQYLKLKRSLTAFLSYSEEEKTDFILNLLPSTRSVAEELRSSRVLPMILTSRPVMLHPEASKHLHPYLFIPTYDNHGEDEPLTSVESFEASLVPVIVKLYAIKKINLRLILLEYLPFYVKHIPVSTVQRSLLPHILIGLRDESDVIVASTYKALAVLVEAFGADAIHHDKKWQDRRKIFSNDIPRVGSEKNSFKNRLPCQTHANDSEYNGSSKTMDNKDKVDRSSEISDDPPTSAGLGSNNSWVAEDNEEQWLDWGADGLSHDPIKTSNVNSVKPEEVPRTSKNKKLDKNQELDIKQLDFSSYPDELEDMFSAMEPKVNFKCAVDVVEKETSQQSSLFAVKMEENHEGGWSDDEEENWNQETQHQINVLSISSEDDEAVTPEESLTPFKTPDRPLTPVKDILDEKSCTNTFVGDYHEGTTTQQPNHTQTENLENHSQ